MTNKKKDTICFDITSLKDDQKKIVAKGFKKTFEEVNEELSKGEKPNGGEEE
ncbi:MAG: hypothetical protein IIA83_12480 [Thaumarchaeota archaeon]|nr:hypothetical protein [Nitrososphaerota archaeon]